MMKQRVHGTILAVLLALPASVGAETPAASSVARILTVPLGGGFRQERMIFFDSHVHLNHLDEVLARMGENGVTRSILFWGRGTGNRQVLEAAQAHPQQLIPFLSVSPERRDPYGKWWDDSDPRLLEYAASELKRGVWKGIGEISIVHFPSHGFETDHSPLHPLMIGLMDLARAHKLPMMIHCETTRAAELDQLLARYPDVAVIWAHGGYASLDSTRATLEAHPRVTLELSMRMVPHPISRDFWIMDDDEHVKPAWLALIEAHPDRFIVGSDAAQRSADTDRKRILSVGTLLGQLTPSTREKVASSNLEALLGSR